MNFKIAICLKENNKCVLKNKYLANYKENEFLIFNEDNYEHTIDLKNKCFYRKDDETNFRIDFQNKKCQITLVDNNKTFDIVVNQCDFVVSKKQIIIKYDIESNEKEIEIKIKLKGKINEG